MKVFRVVSLGVDVEFTDDKKAAETAFKDSVNAELWEVDEGTAVLLRKKVGKHALFSKQAVYK